MKITSEFKLENYEAARNGFRRGKNGGRELLNVEDTVSTTILGLKDYAIRNEERILTIA